MSENENIEKLEDNTDKRLQTLLDERQIGPSSKQEIYEDADGNKWEKLTQRIDQLSGRLEERVKGSSKNIIEKITIREYNEPQTASTQAQQRAQAILDMSEEERQAIIAKRFADKRKNSERREEQMRIAQMDEEELMEESTRKAETRKMEAEVAERNQLAVQNVDLKREIKARLRAEGKNPTEIKNALKDLKKSQTDEANEEDTEKSESPKRGRPAKDALKNPIKDPETGKMVESKK